jgi:hypothetical protein
VLEIAMFEKEDNPALSVKGHVPAKVLMCQWQTMAKEVYYDILNCVI